MIFGYIDRYLSQHYLYCPVFQSDVMAGVESVNVTIFVLIAIILFGIPTLWCFLRFAFRAAQDIIGLSETKIGAITALSLCLQIIVLNVAASVRIVAQTEQAESFWYLASAVAPLCVLVAGIGAILFVDFHFRRKYESFHTSLSQEIQRIVQSIADDLGLSRAPSVRVAAENKSPFCYGRTSKSARLILPKNFEEICLDATEGNEERAHSLMQFVIAHELSHIRNGDCVIMTWLTLFYRYLKVALVFGGICILFSMLTYWEQPFTEMLMVSFLLTAISLPCLKWITAAISRNREFAADARSSLLFDTTTLQKLLKGEKCSSTSAFEYITAFLSMQLHTSSSPVKPKKTRQSNFGLIAELGWAEPKINMNVANYLSRIWNRACRFHPQIVQRRDALLKANNSSVYQPYPSWLSSIQIHVVSTLCFLVLFTILYTMVFPMMKKDLTLSETQRSVPAILSGIALLTFMFLPALAHSVPARISNVRFGKNIGHFITLGKRYLSGASLGLAVLVPLLLLLMATLPEELIGDIVRRHLVLVIICAFCQFGGLLFAFMLASTASSEFKRFKKSDKFQGLALWFTCIVLMLAVASPIVWMLDPVSFLVGVSVGSTIAAYMITKIEGGNHGWRMISVRVGRVSLRLEGADYNRWAYLLIILLVGLPFSALSWFAAIVAWPFTSYCLKAEENFVFVLLFSLLLFLLMFAIAYIVARLEKRHRTRALSLDIANVHSYASILRQTCQKTQLSLNETLYTRFRNARNTEGVYPCRYGPSFAYLETNYDLIIALDNINEELINKEQMINWIMKCHCHRGGYGLWPEASPRLCSTYWALAILKKIEYLHRIDQSKDLKWVLIQQEPDGYFVDPFSSYPKIQQTWYAMQSLKIMDAQDRLCQSKICKWTKALMRNTKTDIFETVYAIETLDTIGALDERICEDAYRKFIEPLAAKIHQLPIEYNLFLLEFYSRLLNKTRNVDPEKSEAIIRILSERVSKASEAYLRTS